MSAQPREHLTLAAEWAPWQDAFGLHDATEAEALGIQWVFYGGAMAAIALVVESQETEGGVAELLDRLAAEFDVFLESVK